MQVNLGFADSLPQHFIKYYSYEYVPKPEAWHYDKYYHQGQKSEGKDIFYY